MATTEPRLFMTVVSPVYGCIERRGIIRIHYEALNSDRASPHPNSHV